MSDNRAGVVPALLLIAAALGAGCSAAGRPAAMPPPAAASGPRIDSGGFSPSRVLSDAEQDRALSAMRTVAEGHVARDPTVVPPGGRTWSDVAAAVVAACAAQEMAVVRSEETPDGTIFHLRSIRDRPGRLEVRRDGERGVGVATASVGRFGDGDAERRLVADFEAALDRLGRRRRLKNR